MNKQTSTFGSGSLPPTRPQWWTDQHTSTWDRVKEALRRDWEQTKADFSSNEGTDLNQEIGDTLKQATGAAPLPPPMVQTRPDDPRDASRRFEKELKERGDLQGKAVKAQTDAAVAQAQAYGNVAHAQQVASEKLAEEQHKLSEVEADAREKVAGVQHKLSEVQADAREKIAKQSEKMDEVRASASKKIAEVQQKAGERVANAQQKLSEQAAEWSRIEPAVRYGYGARSQYADAPSWDEAEARMEREWTQLHGSFAWRDARLHVRRGWDAAARNSLV